MKKSAIFSALSIGVLSISMAFANPAAVSQVRTNSTELMKILNKTNGKNNAEVIRQAENYIAPYFDYEGATQKVVGVYWNKASDDQKKELVQEFRKKLVSDYTGVLGKVKNAKVVVQDKAISNKNNVLVKAMVTPTSGNPIRLDIVLSKAADKFLIRDVRVDGALSFTASYRNQFQAILNQKGISGLINDLKEKNGK